ncbi:MAG: hypothetical protein ISS17_09355 [Bacteroidales bacterium]|nr:hypothetical protein [Bacteroidota bacterium]MBL7138966.1 hypothetical protein [Bacteroidales bacterium]
MKNDTAVNTLIIYFIEDFPVQTFDELKIKSGCQSRTLQRKIKSGNLLASYNKNARFYTVPNLCHFNHYGIWNFEQILFSKYGNLFETIIALIDKSLEGYTSKELSIIIEVKADDALRVLWLKERLRRQKTGSNNVYFSIQEDLFMLQLSAREQQSSSTVQTLALPDYQRTIAVLVEIILQDSIVAEKLQQGVVKRNVEISIAGIQSVIEHYQLKKKRNKS